MTPAHPGAPAVERNHWFEYKYIAAEDLVAEQHYLISRHRAHNRLLHGCGVVCGLELKPHPREGCASGWVVVGAGIAIDGLGRELILTEDTAHQLPVEPGHGGSYVVGLRYDEQPVAPVPILYADPEDGLAASAHNRIREGVEVVAVPAAEFEPGAWEVGRPGGLLPAPATPGGLVALGVADVDAGNPVTVTNRPRRIGLPVRSPGRIVALSWEHGGSLSIGELRADRYLKVEFDRPLAATEGRARGIGPDTFTVTYQRGHEPPRPVPAARPPALADGGRWAQFEVAEEALPREGETQLAGSLVRVTLRCDFIVDGDGVPVSGRHLGGRLPTGDGSPGGTFESWFELTDAAVRRSPRRTGRGKDKEET